MSSAREETTLEALLQHRAWVRRLALSLTRDPLAAGDLEQDAWLSAMRAPPSRPDAARAWFRRVLRNSAAQEARRSEREQRRHVARARRDAQRGTAPATDEIVARAEVARCVVEEVFALREPYRTTVILRYLEGLSAVEIAERQGVPANTVRVRTKRALARLRERLDEGHGDRRAWSVPLLAFATDGAPALPTGGADGGADGGAHAGPGAGSGCGSGGTASATSGAAAARPALLGAAAAALVATAVVVPLVLTAGGGEHLASPAEGAGGTEVATTPERDGERVPGGVAPTVAVPRRLAHGRAAAFGDVRFASDGRAAAGVRVVVLDRAGGERTVRTTAAGAFALDALPSAAPLDVVVRRDGSAPVARRGLVLEVGAPVALGTFWLDAPLAVTVRVRDAAGAPLPGARVRGFRAVDVPIGRDTAQTSPRADVELRADPSGAARFDDLCVGRWTFRADAPGCATAGTPPQTLLRGGGQHEVVLSLFRGHGLRGRVVRTDGTPVAGMTVVVQRPVETEEGTWLRAPNPLRHEATTDPRGRFAFDALPAAALDVGVLPEGATPCRVAVVQVPEVDEMDLVLDGGVLTGRVTAREDGRPLAGAEVRVAVWRRHNATFLSATADADGRYRIDVPLAGLVHPPQRGGNASSGDVALEVRKPGWVLAPLRGPMAWRAPYVAPGETVTLDLHMDRAAGLHGVVLDGDGLPAAGAVVTARVWDATAGERAFTAETGADGAYRFDGLPTGDALVLARKRGLVQSPLPPPAWPVGGPSPEPEHVVSLSVDEAVRRDLRLVRGASLNGTVTADGAPVAGATIALPDRPGHALTSSGVGGEFRVSGLPEGHEVRLVVTAPGFRDGELKALLGTDSDGSPPLTVELEPTGVVHGTVRASDGPLPRGVVVSVAPADAALDGAYEIADVWQRAARAGVAADGSFSVPVPWFGGASASGVVVRAEAPHAGLAPAISERLSLDRLDDPVVLELAPGHELRGLVRFSDGSGPVAGARVEIVNAELPPALGQRRRWDSAGGSRDNHPFEIVALTDAAGRFAVRGLPEWGYELRISRTETLHGYATVAVPGPETVVEIDPVLSIAGTVRGDDGVPVPHVNVIARPVAGGAPRSDDTDERGRFTVRWLRRGPHRLSVHVAADRPVHVVGGELGEWEAGATDVELVVERSECAIDGRVVTGAGAPLPGAMVFAKPAAGGAVVRSARADVDGRFVLVGLESGEYTLAAGASRARGGVETVGRPWVVEVPSVTAPASGVVLTAARSGRVAGRVVRADGGPVPTSLRIDLVRDGSAWRHVANGVAANGAFAVENVPEGEFDVHVVDTATGTELEVVGGARASTGDESVDVVLRAAGGIAGTVADPGGRPLSGALVIAVSEAPDSPRYARTNADGSFAFAGLTADTRWRIEVRHDAWGRDVRRDVPCDGEALELTVVAGPPLAARLVRPDGSPLRSARVEVARRGGVERWRLETDAEGRFRTICLPQGVWEVRLDSVAGRPCEPPLGLGAVESGAPEAVLSADI